MLFWYPRERGCQSWTPSMPRRGDHLRRRFELQTWPLMLVTLLLLCKLAEESMLVMLFSTMLQVELHKIYDGSCFPPCSMPKSQKRESSEKNSWAAFIFPGWPYYVTLPNLLKDVLCILHWTHPLLPCPTSSVLVGSFYPPPRSCTAGYKSATLTEHRTSQMVHLPSATL